ncbi:MAG: hypothetical protein RLZZ356_638, partial [Verrucomicrobiota bacterium]
LGLSPSAEFMDSLGRPRALTDGGVALRELIGT